MRLLVTAVILCASLGACIGADGEDPLTPAPQVAGPPTQDGVVAAAHVLAAEAGAQMLRSGGNAFDAAVAVQLALNVVEPMMNGIGGGSFWMLHDARTDETLVVDGRETMPQAMDPDRFNQPAAHPHQWMGYAAGVPGTLAAATHVLETRGNLTLAEVAAPAIAYAEDGFEVYPYMSLGIGLAQDKLRSWPASAELFLLGAVCADRTSPCQGGVPLPPGHTLVQPDLAETLRTIADEGDDALYRGEIADGIVETVGHRYGAMSLADLAFYEPVVREPLWSTYGQDEVATMPVPGGGTPVAQILDIAEGLDLAGQGRVDRLHLTIEAMRLAYADRDAYLGDPAFTDVPDGLLDPAYLAERRASIDLARAQDPDPGDPDGDGRVPAADATVVHDGGHTTHFVVADGWGNVASVTTTIESVFGNGMVVPGYGFLLNNELTDFHPDPGHPNGPAPGKRPLSSMSPSIVFEDGEPWLAAGSPGGRTIIASVAQVLLNVMERGMPLDAAVEDGRLYPSTFPGVQIDREEDPAVVQGLESRGHDVDELGLAQGVAGLGQGNVHAALRLGDAWTGWADSRNHQGGVVVVSAEDMRDAAQP